ncbi:MAG: PilT/PilU family type 4a pilus ATPase [Candidatus Omnitrophica bacterium]|nr:PilT/PilU family type 4a pilus ATPase [Candidatus Omnitrophota bacterium]
MDEQLQEESEKKTSQQRLRENRQAHRIHLSCPATYQVMEGGKRVGEPFLASTIDISTKGILLRVGETREIGTQVKIQVQVPWSKSELYAVGRIIRVEEEEFAEKYLLGIAFDQIEPAQQVEFLARMETFDLQRLLRALVQQKGSDLHLTTGQPPIARVQDRLIPLNWPPFKSGEIRAIIYGIMSKQQIDNFETQREADFAYSLSLTERFRFNIHWQRNQVEATIRVIPGRIPTWDELGLPQIVTEWIKAPTGLILVAGPTGAGKTTTLNSLVHQINQEQEKVIICLERPIEYVHQNMKSVIKQREVGNDTLSYSEAVRRALRQDPDIIVVGEIEDAETAQIVLNAAESGNLVLASFHATNTIQCIDRFLSIVPAQQRNQISIQLATCLRGILTQYLLPREEISGAGGVLATEVFVPTDAARNYIRTNNLAQLYTVIETGAAQHMHTLDRSIRHLVTQGIIPEEVAKTHLAVYGYSTK